MEIPLTGASTFTGWVVMTAAWLFVGRRIQKTQLVVAKPIRMLHSFFLYMSVFFAFMCLPHLFLYTSPALFPAMMAWGYVVGHFFLYVAFAYIARVCFMMVPQLASKDRLVILVGTIYGVVITLLNAVTMIWGTQPAYDGAAHVTQFHAAVIVGAAIAISALFSLFPAAILFLFNAFKSKGGGRRRALLLGVGLLMMTVSGPLHDVAQNWQSFLVADIFVTLAILLIGAGVIYRLESNLGVNASPAASPIQRP